MQLNQPACRECGRSDDLLIACSNCGRLMCPHCSADGVCADCVKADRLIMQLTMAPDPDTTDYIEPPRQRDNSFAHHGGKRKRKGR